MQEHVKVLLLKDGRSCTPADEGLADGPGCSGGPLIKPVSCGRVMPGVLVGRADEDNGVDQVYQR